MIFIPNLSGINAMVNNFPKLNNLKFIYKIYNQRYTVDSKTLSTPTYFDKKVPKGLILFHKVI